MEKTYQKFIPRYKHLEVGKYQWADELLRYHIGSLQGKYFRSNWLDRIRLARESQKWLRYYGFDWHSQRINNWISKCLRDHGHELKEKQPRKADSLSREREDSLNLNFSYHKEVLKY